MKYILNSREMKQCDMRTIDNYGTPSMVLMERAALSVVSFLRDRQLLGKKIGILCGSGNNGGDGLAIARLLLLEDQDVFVFYLGDKNSATLDNKKQADIFKSYGGTFSEDFSEISSCNVLIDAIFGIGLSRDVTGLYADAIDSANKTDAYRLAVDIPSGISCDTGNILGTAFMADATITFAFEKIGQKLFPGKKYCGQVLVAPIGIEKCSLSDTAKFVRKLERCDLSLLPKPAVDDHKGSRGKVLLIAGSKEIAGAACLAAKSILATGAGLLKVYTHQDNRNVILSQIPEAILCCYDKFNEEDLLEKMAWADAIAIGPGIGNTTISEKILKTTIENAAVPVCLDADALSILSNHKSWLKRPHTDFILTPHLKEMSGLLDSPLLYIQSHKMELARDFANENQVILVLKDAATLTAVPYGNIYINDSGCSGMATAGSGDVLTGMIASLLAQGLTAENAAALGVYLHGLAGSKAAEEKSNLGMLASDLINGIHSIYKEEGR